MQAKRAAERDIPIRRLTAAERRKRAALAKPGNVEAALRWYFPIRFYNDFTEDQREMIGDILRVMRDGGDQSEAATRGDGKTSIAEAVICLCIAWGLLSFAVIAANTGPNAGQILDNIKEEFETNDRLAEHFPEICDPIRALEGAASRANGQTAGGARTRMRWSGDGVKFPTVKGSKASGALLKTRGLDSAIRGLKIGTRRPEFVLIDDPDTEESAESAIQQEKREKIIERGIGGLGGPGRKFGRLMLCTIINRTCLAARYTDPKVKPSWKGKRFKFLKTPPTRDDLWGEYITLWREGHDPNSQVDVMAAHEFYLKNQRLMDAGAVISNTSRFNPNSFPPTVTALEYFFSEVARSGWDVVNTELQNDPPATDERETTGITPGLVQARLSGYPWLLVPRGRLALVGFIDTGWSSTGKGCHYQVMSIHAGFRSHVVDYGVQDVHNVEEIGPERAVLNALNAWRAERMGSPYLDEDGKPCPLDCVLVDSGDGQVEQAVYRFVRESGGAVFRASKGFGSRGDLSPFHGVQKLTRDRKPGEHWFESRQTLPPAAGGGQLWLVGIDADYWKGFAHDRFLTKHQDDKHQLLPGSITLYGDNPRKHQTFAHHICAEVQETTITRGRGPVRKWVVVRRANDWLDCSAGCCCAGALMGCTLTSSSLPMKAKPQSLSEWFGKGKRRTA